MPKFNNNIILKRNINSQHHLEYLKSIKGIINREEIKIHELFFFKFTEPLKYANILLRHAVTLNTKYSQNIKDRYLLSRVYKNLLYKEKIFLSHPAIGRKLYETDTEIVLKFNVMTTDLYKTFYDKISNKPVNVLKLNDNQGVVKLSIIIHIVKNIIEKKDDNKYNIYNIKWEDIISKFKNDPVLINQLGGEYAVDQMKLIYIEHAKNHGNLVSFYEDRVYISMDDFFYNIKIKNAEE